MFVQSVPRTNLYLAITFLALLACQRDQGVTSPTPSPSGDLKRSSISNALAALPELADTIRQVRVDVAEHFSQQELGDAALIQAVRESNGLVSIGLKRPAGQRTRVTGVFEGMSRVAALALRSSLQGEGVTFVHTFRNSATVVARIAPEDAPRLRKLPFVNYLEAPAILSPAQSFVTQYVDTVKSVLGVSAVWSTYGIHGEGVTLTILDTGMDSVHYYNSSGDGPANLASCGYVSSVANTCYGGTGYGYHGAATSGIIAARNNCCDLVGIAYNPANVNMIRVTDSTWNAPDASLATGLDWATSSGYSRHIVNISFGGCNSGSVLSEALARATDAGILVVVAAGNTDIGCTGYPPGATGVMYPARWSQALAVAGTNLDGTTWSGSRYGSQVALSAPACHDYDTYYGNLGYSGCGTSFSAPTVAGIAALVWSQNPTWSASTVVARLEQSAVDNGPVGQDQYFGFGIVSAINAVQTPLTVSMSGTQDITTADTYTWTASPAGANGSYTYAWHYQNYGSSTWTGLGTGSTQSRTVSSTPSFTLRVTVSSPSWQGNAISTKFVTVEIGGGCSPYCE